ncbi:MAG: helix-turn-helix domain-containing protein [Fermentimonas sp.]|jgi:hypothetical protein
MKKIDVIVETSEGKRFEAVIDPDKDYGLTFGLFGEGSSVDECIEDFCVSAEEMKELYDELGKEFPELEFNFKYDVTSFLSYYSDVLSLAGLEKITGVNQRQLSHYLNRVKKPRTGTVEKIEKGIRDFAEELSKVHFV